MKAVSFTGHRPERLGGYDRHHPTNQIVRNWLREVIQRLQKEGYEEFICGGALGIDQWAADIILELGFKLVLAIPYEDYGSNWPDESQKCLAEQRAKASRVVMVCKGGYFDENGNPQKWKNFERNKWMSDNSEVVIAVWDGGKEGGTASAVRNAKKKGQKVIRFNPVTKQEEPV
jgi:uncharacterized phage-like protein YoqJ